MEGRCLACIPPPTPVTAAMLATLLHYQQSGWGCSCTTQVSKVAKIAMKNRG
jgi:hypothetical protein